MRNLMAAIYDRMGKDALIKGKIRIKADGDLSVALEPNDVAKEYIVILIVLQTSNVKWNLIGENNIIKSMYSNVISEIVSAWPDGKIEQQGQFLIRLNFFRDFQKQCLSGELKWSIPEGERFEQRLIKKADGSFYVYDLYPGMPGFGKIGLVGNMIIHYLALVDFALTVMTDKQIKVAGEAISELQHHFLNTNFDKQNTKSKTALGKETNKIITRAFDGYIINS